MPKLQESNQEDMNTLGFIMREVRLALQNAAHQGGIKYGGRWTQSNVSARAGINAAHLSNIETVKSKTKRFTRSLANVARQYDLPADDMEMFSRGLMPDGTAVSESKLADYVQRHVEATIKERGEVWLYGEFVVRGDTPTPAQLQDVWSAAEKNNPDALKLLWDRLKEIATPKLRKPR